jgi:hypothetical protein
LVESKKDSQISCGMIQHGGRMEAGMDEQVLLT